MSHVIWHCGLVGESHDAGPLTWPKFSKFIVAWNLSAALGEHAYRRLERKIERRVRKMAEIAQAVLGGQIREDMNLEGGYCAFGLGDIESTATIPVFSEGLDFTVTFAFESEGIDHAEASALDTRLNVQRYKMYLDVYDITGGEIHISY